MTTPGSTASLEEQIDRWRDYLRRRQAIHTVDVAELEDHLREQISGLTDAGLATDEAFLVAVKRMGNLDALSREFAREHSERLWKQLVLPVDVPAAPGRARSDGLVAFALAALAAILIKLPALFGLSIKDDAPFYLRNLSLFVLPLLCGYFVWKRRAATSAPRWLALGFAVALLFANVYPFAPHGHTVALTALHLPISLWLLVGVAYAGGRWGQVAGRMDFIRFSGEFFIYYVLIALGGMVFTAFMAVIFKAIGLDVEPLFQSWLIPCGAIGAVVVASWLVEAKQSVIENMAPVLTRLFTPLFATLLVVFLGTMLWTGRAIGIARDELIAFDLLLVVVLGLLLYSVSARDTAAPPGPFDTLQVILLISALIADLVALWAIAARISEFGFTPNRVAALGENVILLVNLAGSAMLYLKFLRGGAVFARLEKWQTDYLPVYAVWAAIVVVLFPIIFKFI
ncbi:MAG: permease prefix domain 1-containing protein [Candidatus Eisenbacteria bacterium]